MTHAEPLATVLIVEDEGIIARNLQESLTRLHYDAFAIASTAEEALARVAERCPDVVLMDIRIKGTIDGISTAALLKQRFDVPIIFLTAHTDEATIERAKSIEPLGYLVKPIKPGELRSAIEVARHRHSIEKQLRARERWFSTTVRSIADAVIMVGLDGALTFMNPAAESLIGVRLDDVKGRPVRDVLRLQDAEWAQGQTPLDRALREQQPIHVTEARLATYDAEAVRIIVDSAAPVIDQGEVLGAVMVFRDVTEQKRIQAQLEVADRLAALGAMAAGVAHEINNPLTVIVANTEGLLEYLRGTEGLEANEPARQEAIEVQSELASAATRIAQIVSDLLTFARREPEPGTSAEVRDAIEWAIRSTRHQLRHRARITTKLEDVPPVAMDPTKLGQVFVNLMLNAAQAIAPGDVEVNEVSISTRTDADRVVIEISDTGSGMPPEVSSRVFEPFFTTKVGGIGTGLGLSICHGIVTSSGGEIAVDSQVGKGTTFRVALPVSQRPNTSGSSHPTSAAAGHRGRLLLIDDDQAVLGSLVRTLRDHAIVATSDARDALTRLRDDDNFDVILCDVMMPSMTGTDFYEELARERPDLARRVLFLTGGGMTPAIESLLESVPNQCIHKPFNPASLRAVVQEILTASSNTNREA